MEFQKQLRPLEIHVLIIDFLHFPRRGEHCTVSQQGHDQLISNENPQKRTNKLYKHGAAIQTKLSQKHKFYNVTSKYVNFAEFFGYFPTTSNNNWK